MLVLLLLVGQPLRFEFLQWILTLEVDEEPEDLPFKHALEYKREAHIPGKRPEKLHEEVQQVVRAVATQSIAEIDPVENEEAYVK